MSDRPIATVFDRLRPVIRSAVGLWVWLAAAVGAVLVAFPEPREAWYTRELPVSAVGAAVRPVEGGGEAAELQVRLRSERPSVEGDEAPGFDREFGPLGVSRTTYMNEWNVIDTDDEGEPLHEDFHYLEPVQTVHMWTVRVARWGLLAAVGPAVLLAIGWGVWRRSRGDVPPARRSRLRRVLRSGGRAYLATFALFGVLAFAFPLHRGAGVRVASHWRRPNHDPGLSFGWARPATPAESADTAWRWGSTGRPLGAGFAVQGSSLINWPDPAGGTRDLHVDTLVTPRWPLLVLPLPFALLGLRRPRRLTVPPPAGPASGPG